MRILAIDWGKSKVGLAFAETLFAEPLGVIRLKENKDVFTKLLKIIEEKDIEKVIIGVSRGQSARLSKDFAEELKKICDVDIELVDENISTKEAIRKSIAAGMGPKKRRQMEDAYAAAVILQNYLESIIE